VQLNIPPLCAMLYAFFSSYCHAAVTKIKELRSPSVETLMGFFVALDLVSPRSSPDKAPRLKYYNPGFGKSDVWKDKMSNGTTFFIINSELGDR
jgi:hypothetical protein